MTPSGASRRTYAIAAIVVAVLIAIVAVFAHVVSISSWDARQISSQPLCTSNADLGLPPDPRFDGPKPDVCSEERPAPTAMIVGLVAAVACGTAGIVVMRREGAVRAA